MDFECITRILEEECIMSKNSQHVVKNPNGGWSVKKSGATKATKNFDTQKKAIAYGKDVAKNQHTELYIHRENGRIREKSSYGNDPCPPKDKK